MHARQIFLISRVATFAFLLAAAGATSLTVATASLETGAPTIALDLTDNAAAPVASTTYLL